MATDGKRPKLVMTRAQGSAKHQAAPTEDDFAIYASYQINASGLFAGTLKVVRKSDSRLLFPFEGAPYIGPYASKEEAILAAKECGKQIVQGDLANPEA
jgi:hypothetical protein